MKKLLLFSLFLLNTAWALAQASFYVSPSGNDNNAGTMAKPWKTFQKACNAAIPGSTVYLRAGTYTEKVTMNVAGTSGNYITFRNYGSEVVKISGNSTAGTILHVESKNYLKITGLQFINAIGNNSIGIFLRGTCHHVEIRNCIVTGVHFSANASDAAGPNKNVNPLLVWGVNPSISANNIIIDGNQVYNCRTGYSEALTLNGNVDTFEVTNNTVRDITNIGIVIAGHYGVSSNPATDQARNGVVRGNTCYNCRSPYASSAGLYVDGGRDVILERNKVYNCNVGIEVGCENQGKTTSNVTVRDNITYNNDDWEIGVGGYNYPNTGKVTNTKVLNNTSFKGNTAKSDYSMYSLDYIENTVIENNIISANVSTTLLWAEMQNNIGNVLNYNVWNSPGGANNTGFGWNGQGFGTFSAYQAQSGRDANSIFSNPVFVNTSLSAPNLHLATNSPAINIGNPGFIPALNEKDFDGNNRLVALRVDAGAYEMQPRANRLTAEVEDSENTIKVYPSVTNESFTIESAKPITELVLSDATGRSAYGLKPNEPMYYHQVDTRQLTAGLYVLVLQTNENQRIVKKIIVWH